METVTNSAAQPAPMAVHMQEHMHEEHVSGIVQTGRFLRHLAEMVLAMMVGMGIWGLALNLVVEPVGYGDMVQAYPELRFGFMAVFMALPMVLLMRYLGHSWERGVEMAVAMAAPMIAVVLCWRLGAGAYIPVLGEGSMALSAHVGMYLGMLLIMLYRRKEYTHVHAHNSSPAASHA